MSHAARNISFKIAASFSTLLLLSSCVTAPSKNETTLAPISDLNTPYPAISSENGNIESIRYIVKQQGIEALREPLEPLISSKPELEPLPLASPAPSLLPLSFFEAEVVLEQPHGPSSEAIEVPPPNELATTDLWHRLRQSYALPDRDHPNIKADQDWYEKHPAYLLRVTERARPYMHYILEEVEARGMPAEIALLPIVESAFLPFAYSHGRAAGIWQFIPGTGKMFGLKQNWWYDGRRDVYASTKAALTYLQRLNKTFDGDWLLALAAYNSGSGTVSRAIRKNRKEGKATDYWSLDLPRETEGYVPKLLALSNLVANPSAFGVELTTIPNEYYFDRIDTGGQIDLALAAELAGLSTDELYKLNPGFNRWATDPDGPHHLLIPKEHASRFRDALAKLPENERVEWVRHMIEPGDNLLLIAKKYQTTVALLQDSNKLHGNVIRAGQHLLVPTATRTLSSYTQSAAVRKKAIQQRKRNGYKVTHTVQKGDTLWDISRKYKVDLKALAKWNAMAPRDPLKLGQKLVVWSKKPYRATALNNAPIAPLQKVNYKVRRGDSLSRIAQKFSVSISDLQRWNALNSKKYLQPGQRITLYVDVTRQSGS